MPLKMDPITDRTELRKRLLRNGYSPLPNIDKRCMVIGWPKLTIDEAFIDRYRRAEAFEATGLRIQDGLTAIDGDIPIENLAFDAMRLTPPRGLVRIGKPPKWMVLCRCLDAEFPVLRSHQWTDGSVRCGIEVWLGGSRQVGAFGWHEYDDRERRGVRLYQWPGKSPLDVPLARLPKVNQRNLARICDAFNELAARHGLARLESPKLPSGGKLFDIDEDTTRFDDNQGNRGLTLAQLEVNFLAARHAGRDYRVKSTFKGDGGENAERCHVIWSDVHQCVGVFDFKWMTLHLPKKAAGMSHDTTATVLAEIGQAAIRGGMPE